MSGLGTKTSSAIVAVSDIERAKQFYSDVLGLDLSDNGMEGVLAYRTGLTHLVVYPSELAGTNQANGVVWSCGADTEIIAAELRANGVKFEQYEMDGVTFDNGVHDANGFKMVWFKDPDGNILHLNSA